MKSDDKLAIFDFDGTLIKGDSFIEFARRVCGKRRFLLKCLTASPWLIGWKSGLLSGGAAKERLFGFLYKGLNQDTWRTKCREFVPAIEESLRADTTALLADHRARGHRLIILTASPAEWVRPWAEKAGIDLVIGTEVEIKDGCLTGKFANPNCVGQEKVRRLLEAVPDADECESWAYGDSKSDRPILSFATHGTMVGKPVR